jgi:TIR domain
MTSVASAKSFPRTQFALPCRVTVTSAAHRLRTKDHVSAPSRAVFLSYASEDSEAAARIATALRAAGIEVWFDRSELRGGDAWDLNIHQQIQACRLFIAVISSRTESRDEGYFRREWNLAVDRTRDTAAKRAFLVPVARRRVVGVETACAND